MMAPDDLTVMPRHGPPHDEAPWAEAYFNAPALARSSGSARGGVTHLDSQHSAARSILSAAIAMIDHMDLFDGEPYVSLLPRRLVKFGALTLLIALALIPSVRDWWMNQAVKHATHEIQPLINDVLRQARPSLSDPGQSTPQLAR
jgi:hypothetical protein